MALTHDAPVPPKWLAFPPPLLTRPHPSASPLSPALLCFVAWLNIALYLLHINSVIFLRWNEVALGILIMGVWGSFWLHICCFFSFVFLVPVFFQSIKNECFAIHHTRLFMFHDHCYLSHVMNDPAVELRNICRLSFYKQVLKYIKLQICGK